MGATVAFQFSGRLVSGALLSDDGPAEASRDVACAATGEPAAAATNAIARAGTAALKNTRDLRTTIWSSLDPKPRKIARTVPQAMSDRTSCRTERLSAGNAELGERDEVDEIAFRDVTGVLGDVDQTIGDA